MGCPIEVEGGVKLPAGLFAILNGGTFFYYIPCVMIFAVLWRYCDDEGRSCLVKTCFGDGTSADAAEIAEKIGVGAAAAIGILNSVADLIAAGVSENCGSTPANAFIALNVFVTIANVIACAQVSIIYYGGVKKFLESCNE